MSVDADRSVIALIQAGWEALSRCAWAEAQSCFSRAVNEAESAEALEGLGFAADWLDDTAEMFRAREASYRRYHEQGDLPGAARVAVWLAMDHFTRRGEHAIANGWMQRAYRLLEGLEPGPEHALVGAWDAHMAILVEHDAPKARRLSLEAATLARALGASELAMLAQACEGYVRVCEGDLAGGMRLLDESTAAAVAGELTDPITVNMVCCYLIYACERVRDVERAAQWCDKLRQFTEQWSYQALFAYCQTHYASVLMSRGAWIQAEAELAWATEELAATHPALAVEGIARLAELRRRQGRLDEAAVLLARLADHPLRMMGSVPALLGRAAISLDQGEPLTAAELAERYLRAVHEEDRMERVAGLEVLVQAQAALGDHDGAARTIGELVAIATVIATPPLRAAVSFSEGVIAVSRGQYDEARRHFEDAVDLFDRSGAPYEAARSRLELASVLGGLGRTADAAAEATHAHAAFQELGAAGDAERAAALARGIGTQRDSPHNSLAPLPTLTNRELDVMRLVAKGMSDKETAAALGLSAHTVHRHVSNVLTKLNLPSRAAAVAHVSQNGWL